MKQIQPPSARPVSVHPILNLGFRIFFSAGAVFAMLTMALWVFVFMGKTNIDVGQINPFYWHAHEMLYGYTMAIIAGFLLTAVKTWTGIMMPHGYKLLGIFMLWMVARIAWMMVGLGVPNPSLWFALAGICDTGFMLLMAYAIFRAVLAVKQYKQMGILSKIAFLTCGNLLCYVGIFSNNMSLVKIGDYLGLYLILGLVLTIGRRVIPFFIEKGISFDSPHKIEVKNNRWLDIASLLLFVAFMISDLFVTDKWFMSISAFAVGAVNIIRLLGWYHHGIWKKPLLWSLYLAFLGMCISFFLFAIQPHLGFNHSLAVHALALSGIGMMTVAMMARVSLGHTGRSIHQPPKTVYAMFILMIIAFIFRVFLPLLDMEHYIIWIMIAQTAWIACFMLFCISYIPMLAKPRTDGLFG
ncbi:NnrS family protein [Psychrobacter sp. I-STPA6b]|uniref:NnrS family protein n=1 Tax=Psychrobacter sp. I-STPA6b TaxID=2585718 RepID=UPI001D0CA6BE|nr:NnrS family protein [Psychrobacter sp. I-STPA6b]